MKIHQVNLLFPANAHVLFNSILALRPTGAATRPGLQSDAHISLDPTVIEEYEERYNEFHNKNPQLQAVFKKLDQDIVSDEAQEMKIDQRIVNLEQVHSEQLEFDLFLPTFNHIEPRNAQVEALEGLEHMIENHVQKAMVIMATGLGKTYLAAFFAKRYFSRILFVAHLETNKASFEVIPLN